jgi:hypothetical protein
VTRRGDVVDQRRQGGSISVTARYDLRMRSSCLIALAAACGSARPTPAQPACLLTRPYPCAGKLTTRLHGCVFDVSTEEPLVGAMVVLTSPDGGVTSAVTNSDGEWGADANADELDVFVYVNDETEKTHFHVPPGDPPFLMPSLGWKDGCGRTDETLTPRD